MKYTHLAALCNEYYRKAVGQNVLVDMFVIAECNTGKQKHHDVPAAFSFYLIHFIYSLDLGKT